MFYALEKFRHAVRLRPDFDRGCYNLGTVLYTYACAVQAELANQLKGVLQGMKGRGVDGAGGKAEGGPVAGPGGAGGGERHGLSVGAVQAMG